MNNIKTYGIFVSMFLMILVNVGFWNSYHNNMKQVTMLKEKVESNIQLNKLLIENNTKLLAENINLKQRGKDKNEFVYRKK